MSAPVRLVFRRPVYAGGPVRLVFGAEDVPDILPLEMTATVVLGGPVVSCVALYNNRNPLRVSTSVSTGWQRGAPASGEPTLPWDAATPASGEPRCPWAKAEPASGEPRAPWQAAQGRSHDVTAPWTPARPAARETALPHRSGIPRAGSVRAPWGPGRPATAMAGMPYVRGRHIAKQFEVDASQAQPVTVLIVMPTVRARHIAWELVAPWGIAIPAPPGGVDLPPPINPPQPPREISTRLVFTCPAYVQGEPVRLVFGRVCGGEPEPGATIVVPLRGLYMTHNIITLNRASDGLLLPVTGVELSIDDSSYTWGWSATASGRAEVAALMAALDPDSGEPVEVELGINGVAYRLLTDPVDRQRQFPRTALRIPGRGLAAELDAPVARQMVFSQAAARTAQQLANEALQVNGVGIGWDVDWQLTDWLVPGGVWSHQGTHISAVAAIAGAAGGYIQPHRTARTLRILPRYPAPPWDWPDLTPDYELPIGPVTVEGIQWQRLPDYNRVYVFGEAEPVRGRVTRAGTDGAIEAPMVTNPLITAAEAVLQAGTAVLGNTGKQALVTLTLPVLAETGVILPGALVRYVDGSKSRLGLVRSTSVSWQRPKLRQSIKVETHILEGA